MFVTSDTVEVGHIEEFQCVTSQSIVIVSQSVVILVSKILIFHRTAH